MLKTAVLLNIFVFNILYSLMNRKKSTAFILNKIEYFINIYLKESFVSMSLLSLLIN